MLTQERYQMILDLLARKGAATVTELTQALGASEATIRRDLNALAGMGKLHKVHGGATALSGAFSAVEEDMTTKATLHVEEKALMGRYAASLVTDDDFIFLDAGTSTGQIIDFLPATRACFITNGVGHAQRLARMGQQVYLLGGRLKASTEAVVGTVAVHNLHKYNFTKCFLGANGVSIEAGYTTPDAEEAMLKAEAFSRSYMSYVMADHSKFGLVTPVSFAPLDRVCVITDRLPDPTYRTLTVVKEVARL